MTNGCAIASTKLWVWSHNGATRASWHTDVGLGSMVQRRRRSHHARRDRWAATGGPPQAVMVGMCGAPVGVRGRRGSMRRPCGAPGLPACRAAVGLWGPRRAMSVVDMMCSDGGEGRAIGQPSRCGASPACVRSAVRAGVGGFAAEVGIVCVSVSITPLYLVFGGGTGICFRSHHRAGGGPHAQRLAICRSWCYPLPAGRAWLCRQHAVVVVVGGVSVGWAVGGARPTGCGRYMFASCMHWGVR